jgi:hypothetical protein
MPATFEYGIETNDWTFLSDHFQSIVSSVEYAGKTTSFGVVFDLYYVCTSEPIDWILTYYMVEYSNLN